MKSEISRAAIELETALRDMMRPLQAAANTTRRIAFDNQDAADINGELDRELGAQIRAIALKLHHAVARPEWAQLDAKMQEMERTLRDTFRRR
jgi:hypothetical protein